MKKLFTILFLLTTFLVSAQYSTPGTGVDWSLDDLVMNSEGTVILNGDHYEITNTLTILPADKVSILQDVTVLFHELASVVSEGTLIIDAPAQSVFTAQDTTLTANRWRGFKLIEGHTTHIKNATFSFGGGLRVQAGTFSMDGSTLYKSFYKSGSSAGSYTSSAALDVSGYVTVTNNNFILNQRGAVASATNVSCAANIRNNYMFGNTTDNTNRPQINMGPAGSGDTTFIVGNTIIGDGNTRSGGISYSCLLGGGGTVVVDSNLVDQNRYGITLTGSPINGIIRHNTITDNNIEGNPALGGSGLNFTASSASANQTVMVTGNTISGNLWGITIIGYAQVNMGDSATATFNPGGNVFSNNGNNDIPLCDLYNNGPVDQTAMYNCWGVATQDSVSIESVVMHVEDDETLGRVNFMPSCAYETNFIVQNETGTMLPGVEIAIADMDETLITDVNGESWAMIPPGSYTFTATLQGYAVYEGSFTVASGINTINITLSGIGSLYQLTFTVTDPESQPLEGVNIDIEGQTTALITNVQGIASTELPDGTYNYSASLAGYNTITGTTEIDGANASVNITMSPVAPDLYTLTFNVTDELQAPVVNAQVQVADQTLFTNDLGVISLELTNGSYPYVVSKEGYNNASGTALIENSNTVIDIELISEAVPLYLLTFTVTSPGAQPLEGVSINIEGETTVLITNAQGIATIELADGSYIYSATLEGYNPATGTAQINGANTSVNIQMEPGAPDLYTLTFNVTDEFQLVVSGAQVAIAGQNLLTNEQGVASLELANGTYPFVVSKAGYTNVSGSAVVESSNVEVDVVLNVAPEPLYLLKFIVTDPELQPLEGVRIDIEGQATYYLTNAQGMISMILPDGTYNYTASLAGYDQATGTAQINGANVSVNIELQPAAPSLYTVTFIVDSNTGILEDAEILINGEALITNNQGIATIQLLDGEYPYVATANDFSIVEGTVTVNGADVEVQVFLYTGLSNPLKAALRVYPNPVVDRLYLQGAHIDAVEVYSITGKSMLRFEQVNGFIELRDLDPGMYLIRVISQDMETTLRVVKK